MGLNIDKELGRDLGIDHVTGGGQRDPEYQQNPSDQNHRLPHDDRQLTQGDFAQDENFDQQHITGGDGRRFADRKISTVDSAQNHKGQRQFPDRFAQGAGDLLGGDFAAEFFPAALVHDITAEQNQHQHTRQCAGQKQVIQPNSDISTGLLSDDSVKNQG